MKYGEDYKQEKAGEEQFANVLVSRKKVEWVAYKHGLSEHAKIQLVRRGVGSSLDLKGSILNSPLAWKTHNGCIAIALDLYKYAVVSCPEMGKGKPPIMVTIIDLEPSGCNVVDKMMINYREFCRPKQSFRTV